MSKPAGYQLAIVIPLFNEAKGVERCVSEVQKVLRTLPDTVLITVNDGSKDQTFSIIQKLQKQYSKTMIVVNHVQNKGYGAALQTGIQTAAKYKAQYTLFMDSDLTNPPACIPFFYKKIPLNFDCIKATRFNKGGKMKGVPAYRQLLSHTANIFARLCFQLPIHDCTNGFRMVKTSLLQQIPYTRNDFSIIVEELYYLKKMKVTFVEIPTILTNRTGSKSNFSYSFPLLFAYARFTFLSIFV